MRITLIGQSALGQKVLEALAQDDADEIVGVFAPPAKEGRPDDPVITSAKELGIQSFDFKRLRDQEAVDQFKALDPELCVMAFVTDIVPMEMINFPSLGTIQYHPSMLPKHRGPSSINWPIINGETETGLTIFWPDEGLDTGPVLKQVPVEIGSDETLGSVYFNKLFPLGVEAMVESVNLVREGNAPRIVQDESGATYEGWCRAKDVTVDWSADSSTVFNMIRGGDPQPGANTVFGETVVSLYDASRSDSSPASAGEILEISDSGITVSAADGTVTIGRVREKGGPKQSAAEWAESKNISVGDRLG